MLTDYYNTRIQLNESGSWDRSKIGYTIGHQQIIVPKKQPNSYTSGKIHSISFFIKDAVCKFDFDVLLLNSPACDSLSIIQDNTQLKLSIDDSIKVFSKLRIQSMESDSDDYLQPIGGHYFGSLYNLNIPFRGSDISIICVYQEVEKKTCALNHNIILTFNYEIGNIG